MEEHLAASQKLKQHLEDEVQEARTELDNYKKDSGLETLNKEVTSLRKENSEFKATILEQEAKFLDMQRKCVEMEAILRQEVESREKLEDKLAATHKSNAQASTAAPAPSHTNELPETPPSHAPTDAIASELHAFEPKSKIARTPVAKVHFLFR